MDLQTVGYCVFAALGVVSVYLGQFIRRLIDKRREA